jgi:hypothetical protein
LQDDLCSFFNALMTCSGAQLDSGTSVVNCSITRDKGPPYAFIKLRSVQETSNALAFSGIQFRGSTLKVAAVTYVCVGSFVALKLTYAAKLAGQIGGAQLQQSQQLSAALSHSAS